VTAIVVVGCGFPQLGLLSAARGLGLRVIGADLNPHAAGVHLVDDFHVVSTADVAAVADLVRKTGAAGLTSTGSELSVATCSAVAAELSLPFYADPETIRRCQVKDLMRAGYESAGLPVPRFLGTHDVSDAERFVAVVGVPVVVKPARGWGQRGVSRVDREVDLAAAFASAAAVSHGDAGVVIEECIVGHEISVNGWIEDGALVAWSVTDREVFAGASPLGVMRSEVVPCSVTAAEVDAAVDAARRGARALGLVRGPCYTQVCVTPRGPVVFETAARCGGGFDADVTRLVSGVDLYRRLLGVALGDASLEREGAVFDKHPAALVRFLAPPRGEVVRVSGVEAARALPGVVDAAVYARVGDRLEGLVNASSRVAHVLAWGDTREQAVARADAAEAAIEIVTA
jgi:biotin carboxylase